LSAVSLHLLCRTSPEGEKATHTHTCTHTRTHAHTHAHKHTHTHPHTHPDCEQHGGSCDCMTPAPTNTHTHTLCVREDAMKPKTYFSLCPMRFHRDLPMWRRLVVVEQDRHCCGRWD